jgi:hypothetical protein
MSVEFFNGIHWTAWHLVWSKVARKMFAAVARHAGIAAAAGES